MISRVCPRCGSKFYTSDTRDWICKKCGELLTDKNNLELGGIHMGVEYEAQAVLGLSNFGGVSIMLDPVDSDYLYYKWYEDEPVRAKIYYTEMGEEEDLVPVFNVGTDEIYRIDEFIRVGI